MKFVNNLFLLVYYYSACLLAFMSPPHFTIHRTSPQLEGKGTHHIPQGAEDTEKELLESLAATCNGGSSELSLAQVQQIPEPPSKTSPPRGFRWPRTPGAAHHCWWAHCCGMGGSQATEQLLHSSCLTRSSFPIHKKGIFPCQGVCSGGKQQLYSRDE